MAFLHHSRALTFTWDAVSDPDLAGYNFYAGRSSGVYTASGSPKDMGNNTSGTFTTDEDGLWYFAIKAYNTIAQESDNYSTEIVVQLPRPSGFIG